MWVMYWLWLLWSISLISQLGKHFWPSFSYVGGLPIDYLSPTIYISELASVSLIIIAFKKLKIDLKYLGAFLVIAVINVAFAFNQPLALISWTRFLFLVLLVAVVSKISNKSKAAIVTGLKISLLLTLGLCLLQLIYQRSLGGVWYFLGERTFSMVTPYVAKFIFFGRLLLRPYASFSHPNSMAGFFLAVLIILGIKKSNNKVLEIWQYIAVILILLTGSRVAIGSTGLFFLLKQIESKKIALFLTSAIVISSAFITIGTTIVKPELKMGETIYQRLVLAQAMAETASQKPLTGVGLGNSIPATFQTSSIYRYNFWYQPVHNVWLLLLTETGGLLTALIIVAFTKMLYRLANMREFALWSGWVAILFSSLFDHYLLTLVQNRLILAVLLGLTLQRLATKKH